MVGFFQHITIKLSETSLPGATIVWLLHIYLLSFYDPHSCSVSVIYCISEWHEMGKTRTKEFLASRKNSEIGVPVSFMIVLFLA